METLIVRAYTGEDAIKSAGVQFCGKKLIQLMAGPYFYIEYHQLDDDETAEPGWGVSSEKFYSMFDEDDNILAEEREYTIDFKYKIYEVPLPLAWFVIDALRLKSQISMLGEHSYPNEKVSVYLTPGAKIFGHKVTELTEIKAELRPVIVERL